MNPNRLRIPQVVTWLPFGDNNPELNGFDPHKIVLGFFSSNLSYTII